MEAPSFIERHPLLAFVVASTLFFALAVPLALVLDEKSDRMRPMYEDAVGLGMLLAADGGAVDTSFAVSPGAAVTVDGEVFEASRGVTLVVRSDGSGFCIRAGNQHGDRTGWLCGGAERFLNLDVG